MPHDIRSVAARRVLADLNGPPRVQSGVLAALDGVRHGFFGREGGVSTGLYASLNCGPGSADAPEAVAENRARVAAALGAGADRLVTVHQIHSPRCVVADGPWPGERPQADAIATAVPGLVIGVLAADCAPVLFADADAGVIGAAHAGWKGAVGGVLQATLEAMETLGAQRARIVAAIGPCIRQPSYEVGPEFRTAALGADPRTNGFFKAGRGDRLHFDLPGYCVHVLQAAGVSAVDAPPFDTLSDPTMFFSYRRTTLAAEPDYGRQISAITMTP